MNVWLMIFSKIRDFAARVSKVIPHLSLELKFHRETESKKETFTAEIGKNSLFSKQEIMHKKSKTSFSIGIYINIEKNKSELFISINSVDMLMNYKYLLATPLCSGEEQCNEDGEVRYNAIETINEEYFSEKTSEARKDKIIEQILTEVAENLNNNCSPDEGNISSK